MPDIIETAPEESSDLRSDLTAALEQAESSAAAPPTEAEVTPPAPSTEAAPETQEAKDARARDEKGRFAKSDLKADLTQSEKVVVPDVTKPAPVVPEQVAPAAEPLKAPASWKALAREEWGKTPPTIQQEVLRRERETAMALEQSAEARQGHQRFREILAPYEPMLRGQGADPYQAVQGLLQTAAALATAPIQQRATILAGLIKTYLPGKDSLEVLDSTLSGVLQGHVANQSTPQYAPDPRLDEIYQSFQQARQMQAQTLEQQAASGIREVQGNEFYEDVKLIMADMLEVAGNQGIALTPSEAYTRATFLHPEVSKVLEQRQAAKLASNPVGSTARARAAASSVRGSPAAPPPNGAQPDDLRSVLESAFDRAGSVR
jgi:hypothetical protein